MGDIILLRRNEGIATAWIRTPVRRVVSYNEEKECSEVVNLRGIIGDRKADYSVSHLTLRG